MRAAISAADEDHLSGRKIELPDARRELSFDQPAKHEAATRISDRVHRRSRRKREALQGIRQIPRVVGSREGERLVVEAQNEAVSASRLIEEVASSGLGEQIAEASSRRGKRAVDEQQNPGAALAHRQRDGRTGAPQSCVVVAHVAETERTVPVDPGGQSLLGPPQCKTQDDRAEGLGRDDPVEDGSARACAAPDCALGDRAQHEALGPASAGPAQIPAACDVLAREGPMIKAVQFDEQHGPRLRRDRHVDGRGAGRYSGRPPQTRRSRLEGERIQVLESGLREQARPVVATCRAGERSPPGEAGRDIRQRGNVNVVRMKHPNAGTRVCFCHVAPPTPCGCERPDCAASGQRAISKDRRSIRELVFASTITSDVRRFFVSKSSAFRRAFNLQHCQLGGSFAEPIAGGVSDAELDEALCGCAA